MARRRHRRHHHVNRRHHHRRRLRNPRGYRRSHRRLRNPRHGGGGSIRSVVRDSLMPAAIGGVGALSLDVVMGYLNSYLPASLQAAPGTFNALNFAVKAAGAIGVGMLASRFLGRSRGEMVAVGALTVTVYSAIRTFTAGSGIPGLSGYADYTPYPMGAYMRGPTGTPGIQGLGYVSPGAVIAPTLTPKLGAYIQRPGNVATTFGGDYSDGM